MAEYDTAPYLVNKGVLRVHMNCWVDVNESLPLDNTQVNSKNIYGTSTVFLSTYLELSYVL